MQRSSAAILLLLLLAPTTDAQDLVSIRPDVMLFVLQDASAQRELGVPQETVTQFKVFFGDLLKETHKATLEVSAELPIQGRSAAILELRHKSREKMLQALEEGLSPDQFARLRQLARRSTLASSGYLHMLTIGELARDIGMNPQQASGLARRIPAIEAKAWDRIGAVLTEMEQEIVNELTPDQAKTFHEMHGQVFLGDIVARSMVSRLCRAKVEATQDPASQQP